MTHDSITSAMRRAGLDRHFVDYVCRVCAKSETSIRVGKSSSEVFMVHQGVMKCGPLSPLLFKMVIDDGLASLPFAVGYGLGSERVNALAFADDVILVAETRSLRLSCEAFSSPVALDGLRINSAKSTTWTLVPSGKDHRLNVVDVLVYCINGNPLSTTQVFSLWRYLGIDFVGRLMSEFSCASYVRALECVNISPMTPR